jgi:hypothetical protein
MDVELVIEKVRAEAAFDCRVKMFSSRGRLLYPIVGSFTDYVYSEHDSTLISWLMKARAELIHLNKYSWTSGSTRCSLCNRREEEDVFHFVAKCPALSEFRLRYLQRSFLSLDELVDHLSGKNWTDLSHYCKNAWKYRFSLIEEFNY